MTDQVRVAVIGTSWCADLMHLPSLISHPACKVVAICGRNADRATDMAEKYGIPQVFTNYHDLVERAQLDAVVISTPDDTHYPIAMDALDARLHIVCEKPLALTAGQAKEMYERAEAVGVKHMTYFTWRWLPLYQHLAHLIEDGYLGRVYHGQWRFIGDYGRDGEYNWRFDRRRAYGVLADLGSHMVDLARWQVGEIVRVAGQLAISVERSGPEGEPLDSANDAAMLLLQFENGAHGMIQVSAVAHIGDRGLDQAVMLHGEAGTLEADFAVTGVELRGARSTETQIEPLPIPDDLWGAADRDDPWSVFTAQPVGDRFFVDAIVDDRPITPSFYDGFKAQEVIEAANTACQTGTWVSIPTDTVARS